MMVRENFLEGTISVKNKKTLENAKVGTDIPGEKYTKSQVSRTGLHGCTWGSQMCDREEALRKRSQALIFRRLDFILE